MIKQTEKDQSFSVLQAPVDKIVAAVIRIDAKKDLPSWGSPSSAVPVGDVSQH
jgi:hypothetical protein